MLLRRMSHRTGAASDASLSATPAALIAMSRGRDPRTPAPLSMDTSDRATSDVRSQGDTTRDQGFSGCFRRSPRQDATPSCPQTASPRPSPSNISMRRTRTSPGASNRVPGRTIAVTSCPRSAARRTRHRPQPPDAPRTKSLMHFSRPASAPRRPTYHRSSAVSASPIVTVRSLRGGPFPAKSDLSPFRAEPPSQCPPDAGPEALRRSGSGCPHRCIRYECTGDALAAKSPAPKPRRYSYNQPEVCRATTHLIDSSTSLSVSSRSLAEPAST